MDLKKKIQDIQKFINLNQFSEANSRCEKLIKKYPDNPYFYNLNGLILQSRGHIKKSVEYFQKAMALEENNFAAMNNLANSFKNLFEYEKSEDLYKKVLKNDPKNIKALNNYSNLKKEFNKYDEAKKLLLEALKIEPNNISILSNLAVCCQGLGEMKEAKNYSLKILDINPFNSYAHKFISGVVNFQKEPKQLEKTSKIIKNEKFKNFSLLEKKDIYFALGKAYEDQSDYKNAFTYLNKANSIMSKNNSHNLSDIKKIFKNIIKFFDSFEIKELSKLQTENKNIFICGMPRSGTTLIEQIVASHSEVSGAGELQYLSKIINENFIIDSKFNNQKILEEMSKKNNTVYEKYNNLLNFHNFKTTTITDKAPQNFIWIGFIIIFFPNSKIIHCSRNPKDNCLSLYKNYFSSNSMFWTYNQKDIAEYYILYSELMNFWKSKFADFIFEAKYEDIVNSPENEVKKMLSFCGLNWEPECLNFYQNKKTPVQTVSVSQASKPIYKSSINSNEGYAEYLNEMFNILDTKL